VLKNASRNTAMPRREVTKTASDHPVPVVSGPKLSRRASHGIPRVERPSAMAPNALTIPMTRVRAVGFSNADPMSPQNGTSQTVYASPHST
jgi:hypothetical protein